MTVLDLTSHEVTRADCYQRFTNPQAKHQLRILWTRRKLTVRVLCNCGTTFTERRPELAQMQAIKDEYELHVMQVVTR